MRPPGKACRYAAEERLKGHRSSSPRAPTAIPKKLTDLGTKTIAASEGEYLGDWVQGV